MDHKRYVNGGEIGKYGIRIEDGTSVIISGVGSEASTEAQLYIGGGINQRITQSFFGGTGAIGKAGQSARIVSDYSIVKDSILRIVISRTAMGSTVYTPPILS